VRIGIHQPNFFPWLGYFHKIKNVDKFVILDNVDIVLGASYAITNRTKIQTSQGELWLTVPLQKGQSKKIIDIQIDYNQNWKAKHLKTLELTYKKAPNFKSTFTWISGIYANHFGKISDMNSFIIKEVSKLFNIKTEFIFASELGSTSLDKNNRIIEICNLLGGNTYLSGNGAKKYNDESKFQANKIDLLYTSYTGVEYTQFNSPHFVKGLSIIDLMMNKSNKDIVTYLE